MQLSAGDAYRFYRPSPCGLRLHLHHQGIEAAPPGPFDEVIRRLGERHEQAELAKFEGLADLRRGTLTERCDATLQAVQGRAPIIYQALFCAKARLGVADCDVVGSPDFLLEENGDYVIRDVKIARRINEKDHPEILWQLRLYGWLFERAVGSPPSRLEVYSGAGEIVVVEPSTVDDLERELGRYVETIVATEAPFAPVGWSKCGDCGYYGRCWTAAEELHDVALVPRVDQGLVLALREAGVSTYEELLSRFSEDELADLRRTQGTQLRKVGKAAGAILRSANALATSAEIPIAAPALRDSPNYAMFDLEGLPPHLDEIEKIYLWGLQVFGDRPSEFLAAMGGFGADGDRDAWISFLRNAREVFETYGDIPFVHWHHYERVKIDLYTKRFGDPDGIAARVRANLLDLLPVMQSSVALPLPSYSLKVVERHVGFNRTQTGGGGDWAMARYIEATETSDEALRQSVLSEIMTYNREDLEATWAVFCWLREFGRRHYPVPQ